VDGDADAAGDGATVDAAAPTPPANLIRQTLPADIRTASFYELVDWARSLGLSTRGTRRDLQDRIARHFDVPLSDVRADSQPEEGRTVVIESANESEYFSLEAVEEEYVRLRGGVRLRTRQEDDSTVHIIEAEEIIFNRAQNTLTANGNVRYQIDREGEVEEFTGRTLSFELDTWEGQFIQGVSSRERDIEGRQVRFRYSGDYMTRTVDDIVIMEEGTITSSTATPPNYHIRAGRIWVFGAGEWAIRGARLYVGRVPIFVFPFFFKPGDELFFNPVAGTRSRAGAFIQTTTYVVGDKDTEEAAISFLQVTDDEATGPRKREGLFLTRDAEVQEEEPSRDIGTVKLLFDVYTKLGAYAGAEADLSSLGAISSLQGSLGIAASRHLYPSPNTDGTLVPYRTVGEEIQSDWNTTNFLGNSLPFRYLLDVSGNARESWFSGSAGVELYSDPFVGVDFDDRAEDMDWFGLLSNEQSGASSSGAAKSNLRWESSLRLSPSTGELSPYLSSFSVREFGASLDWQSRDLVEPEPEIVEADRSPEATFFYPARSVLPSLGISAGGTVFSYPLEQTRRQDGDDDERQRVEAPFRSPWEEPDPDGEADPDQSASQFRPPPIRSSSGGFTYPEVFGSTIGYRLNSTTTVENSYDDDEWTTPDAVTFDVAYSSVTTNNTGQLTYSSELMERLFTLSGAVEVTGRYRRIYNQPPDPEEDILSIERQAAQYRSFATANSSTFTVAPLPTGSLFGASNLEYRLGADIFRVVYDEEASEGLSPSEATYKNETIEWTDEFVTTHSVTANLQASVRENQQLLSVSTTLPPLEQSYEGRLASTVGPWNGTVRIAATDPKENPDPDGTLTFDPLSFDQRLSFARSAGVSQALLYNIEEESFQRLTFGLRGSIGSANVALRRTKAVRFEPDFIQQGLASPWVEEGDEGLRPATANGSVSYTVDPLPIWKNRITFDATGSAGIDANLQRFTESQLTFEAGIELGIHEFLNLSFSSTSRNDFIYQYIPVLAERVGRAPRNPLADLARSFNFFDRAEREASFFNVQTLKVSATHRLGDWDVVLSYTGRPALSEESTPPRYEWDTEFSIVVQWRPLPELKSDVTYRDDTLEYRTGQQTGE
jgi:lipopolysaccharide assembly outer membrane protein LptD (OstA)